MNLHKNRWIALASISLASLISTGCLTKDDNSEQDSKSAPGTLFVQTSDFKTGALESVSEEFTSYTETSMEIASDARVQANNGSLYVLERYGYDNILKLDPAKGSEEGVIWQSALDENANPHQIAFSDDGKTGYVSQNGSKNLVILDLSSGKVVGKIDLSSYSHQGATTPFMSPIAINANKLYVGIQRLGPNWEVDLPGLLVVIDTKTKSVTDTLQLKHRNPKDMEWYQGQLLIASTAGTRDENISDENRGVEAVDVEKLSTKALVTGKTLEGGVNDIEINGDHAFISIYKSYGNTPVAEIDLASGKIVKTLDVEDAFGGMLFDPVSEKLFIGERGAAAGSGLKIWDGKTMTQIGKDALPPSSMAMVN